MANVDIILLHSVLFVKSDYHRNMCYAGHVYQDTTLFSRLVAFTIQSHNSSPFFAVSVIVDVANSCLLLLLGVLFRLVQPVVGRKKSNFILFCKSKISFLRHQDSEKENIGLPYKFI